MTKEKKFTWYDLKRYCNSLSGEQLGHQVKAHFNRFVLTGENVEIMEDDMFDPSGQGLEPTSNYKKDPVDWEQVKNDEILAQKGEPRLIIS